MLKSANVGPLDRVVRIIAGVMLIAIPYLYTSPIWANPLGRLALPVIGLVLVATAFFRFCPFYRLIGVSTCKVN